jgi:hypothetical protein
MKTPARSRRFRNLRYRLFMGLVVTMIVMTLVPVVLAVLPASVLAVNPMVPALHVPRGPNHFIVVVPIACAMVVEWFVANLDLDAIRSNGGRNKNARRNNGSEQKFVFNHCTTDSGAHPSKHGFISKESGNTGEN